MDPDRGRTLRALSATSTPEVTAGARAGLRLCSPANEVSCAGQGVLLTFPALGAPGRAGKEHPALGKGPPILPGKEKLFPGQEEPPSFREESSDRPGRRVSSVSSQLGL